MQLRESYNIIFKLFVPLEWKNSISDRNLGTSFYQVGETDLEQLSQVFIDQINKTKSENKSAKKPENI